MQLEAVPAHEVEAVVRGVDGQVRLEDLLVAPGGLEVAVPEVGLEQVAVAGVLGRGEDLLHRDVLLRDVERPSIDLDHVCCSALACGPRRPSDEVG